MQNTFINTFCAIKVAGEAGGLADRSEAGAPNEVLQGPRCWGLEFRVGLEAWGVREQATRETDLVAGAAIERKRLIEGVWG